MIMLCVFYLAGICGALAHENGKYMAGEKEKKLRPTAMLMLTCMPKHKNYNHILARFDWDLDLATDSNSYSYSYSHLYLYLLGLV